MALTGAEIRSQIVGRAFGGRFDSEQGGDIRGHAYFGLDGKFLLSVTHDRMTEAVILGRFELKDDLICVQQIGAMRNALGERCFKAFGHTKSGSWSGVLSDVQDSERGIPLDWTDVLGPAELEALWSNWESLQKEAGPVDRFESMEEVRINLFRFKGKTLLVTGSFRQMIGDGRALFQDGNLKDMVLEGVPNDLFQDEYQTAILIGEFTGTFQMTIEGSDVFLPVMTLKAARTCKAAGCREYFPTWE